MNASRHTLSRRVVYEPLRALELQEWVIEPCKSTKKPYVFAKEPYRSHINASWYTLTSDR